MKALHPIIALILCTLISCSDDLINPDQLSSSEITENSSSIFSSSDSQSSESDNSTDDEGNSSDQIDNENSENESSDGEEPRDSSEKEDSSVIDESSQMNTSVNDQSSGDEESSATDESSAVGVSIKVVPVTERVEVESFVSDGGVTQIENDGTTVGFFDVGDWLGYSVDFGTGANVLRFSLASGNSTGIFEVRLDSETGTVIGTLNVLSTGGWTDFTDVSLDIIKTSGVQDIFIVGSSGNGICNFDYFEAFNIVKPTTPTGLTAEVIDPTDNTIKISWTDASDNETGFKIYSGRSNNKPRAAIETVAAGVTTYTATDLKPGTEYFFWVTADNSGMIESDAVSVSDTTTGVAPVQEEFTIVIIPDTQFYHVNYSYHNDGSSIQYFHDEIDWVVENVDEMNIVFLTHVGDIVENGMQMSEWADADAIMSKLDGIVPYGISPGNHDCDSWSPSTHGPYTRGYENFSKTFPESRFTQYSWYGDDLPDGKNWNSFQLFEAGGLEFIIIHYEYNAKGIPEVVNWVDQVLTDHPNRRAILSTHNEQVDGGAMWDAIKKHSNVFLLNRGHIPGEAHDVVIGNNGNKIQNILVDYQGEARGGNGWLRYYTFKPSEDKVYGRSYSPSIDQYRPEFSFDYSM